jgi:hypothetical protein
MSASMVALAACIFATNLPCWTADASRWVSSGVFR